MWSGSFDAIEIHSTELCKGDHDGQGEADIADAVGHKSLLRSGGISRLLIPETDQKVRGKAHAFPTDIEVEIGITEYKQKHRSDKEIEICEETAAIFIVRHIGDRVDVNKCADASNEENETDR